MTDTIDVPRTAAGQPEPRPGKPVKCVVWDLDHTVWDGILLEDGDVPLRPGVLDAIRTLDGRGILQSVASRNDADAAMARLRALGIDEYFLYPQINWNAKGQNVAQIAKSLNIGLDTLLFIDDQPFEREEVAFTHDKVLCIDSALLDDLLDRLRPLETDAPAIDDRDLRKTKGAHWVRPELVCEVEFLEMTDGGKLRAPSFKGLRTDKLPADCVIQKPAG